MGHVKGLLASRPSVDSSSAERIEKDSTFAADPGNHGVGLSIKSTSSEGAASNVPADDCPQTPSGGVDVCLSSKKKKRKREGAQSGPPMAPKDGLFNAAAGSGKDGGVSAKRRRKRWSSVKEIALSSERERERRISSLPIPFLM